MNDNLSASFVLMAGSALLAYWFFHLTGQQRRDFLAHLRSVEAGAAGPLQPYMPEATAPTTPPAGGKGANPDGSGYNGWTFGDQAPGRGRF